MDIGTIAAVIGTGVGVIAAGTAAVRHVARNLRSLTRELTQWREDWNGEPARPGFPRRPGVPERLEFVESQLKPNGGTTARDAINRIELQQSRQAIDMGILARRLDQHLEQVAPAIAELIEWRRQQNAISSGGSDEGGS